MCVIPSNLKKRTSSKKTDFLKQKFENFRKIFSIRVFLFRVFESWGAREQSKYSTVTKTASKQKGIVGVIYIRTICDFCLIGLMLYVFCDHNIVILTFPPFFVVDKPFVVCSQCKKTTKTALTAITDVRNTFPKVSISRFQNLICC